MGACRSGAPRFRERFRSEFAEPAGSVIAVLGFGFTAYLAMQGHEMIALTISLPLATILAIIVGNKVIGA